MAVLILKRVIKQTEAEGKISPSQEKGKVIASYQTSCKLYA